MKLRKKRSRRYSLDNLRIILKEKWDDMGYVNQVLLVFACLTIVGFSASTYYFVTKQLAAREIKCLAMNVYHEARGEPLLGQYAVATVTMNRVASKRYPDDVCKVVYQRNWSRKHKRYVAAFSWTNDKIQDVPEETPSWKEALVVARHIYHDEVESHAKDALFYHADYVKPRWAKKLSKVTKIGKHIFYK